LRGVEAVVEVVDGLVGLPEFGLVLLGEVGVGVGVAVAEFLLGVRAVEVEGRVLALEDEVRLQQSLQLLARLLLLLLQKVLQHR
jgi:hypothetical protein